MWKVIQIFFWKEALSCLHRKLFGAHRCSLESTMTQFALLAMLTNGLHRGRFRQVARGTKRAEIERITTSAGKRKGCGSACTRKQARRERGAA